MELLVSTDQPAIRCCQCTVYRSALWAIASRKRKLDSINSTNPMSHTNYRYLTDSQKNELMMKRRSELVKIKLQRDRLKAKLEKVSERQGVIVKSDIHNDLCPIISNECDTILQLLEDSFRRIFWEQQSRAASKKAARGMRWHPLMIRWCLSLHHQLQKAYENVHEILTLPSQRTLRDYTHHLEAGPGFSADVDGQLTHSAAINTLKEWQKCVILLLDEMHIKENLVYDKLSGNLIGFTHLGEVNNHLLPFEQDVDHMSPDNLSLAKSMMTFMIRGLFTSLKFPYAHFPCLKISGELLFDPFWEAVYRLERCGFRVCLDIHNKVV